MIFYYIGTNQRLVLLSSLSHTLIMLIKCGIGDHKKIVHFISKHGLNCITYTHVIGKEVFTHKSLLL